MSPFGRLVLAKLAQPARLAQGRLASQRGESSGPCSPNELIALAATAALVTIDFSGAPVDIRSTRLLRGAERARTADPLLSKAFRSKRCADVRKCSSRDERRRAVICSVNRETFSGSAGVAILRDPASRARNRLAAQGASGLPLCGTATPAHADVRPDRPHGTLRSRRG